MAAAVRAARSVVRTWLLQLREQGRDAFMAAWPTANAMYQVLQLVYLASVASLKLQMPPCTISPSPVSFSCVAIHSLGTRSAILGTTMCGCSLPGCTWQGCNRSTPYVRTRTQHRRASSLTHGL